jgi:hypothetical protein
MSSTSFRQSLRRLWALDKFSYSVRVFIALTGSMALCWYQDEMGLLIPLFLGIIASALAETDDSWQGRLNALAVTLVCFSIAALSVELLFPYPIVFAIALALASVRPDHARCARRALWRDCLGDADSVGVHDDRRRSARWRGHRFLARTDAAGRRRRVVRFALGAVAGAVFQPAGAAESGAVVPRAGFLPEAEILAVRADPPVGRRSPAPGTRQAKRQSRRCTEQRQGNHSAPRRQRSPRLESQPLPEAVLPRTGHSRTRQFFALSVQRAG